MADHWHSASHLLQNRRGSTPPSPLLHLFEQDPHKHHLILEYQEVLQTATAAIDTLAQKYGVRGEGSVSSGWALTRKFLDFLLKSGPLNAGNINEKTFATFAQTGLKVKDGRRFASDLLGSFFNQFVGSAMDILAPLRRGVEDL